MIAIIGGGPYRFIWIQLNDDGNILATMKLQHLSAKANNGCPSEVSWPKGVNCKLSEYIFYRSQDMFDMKL